MRRTGKAIGTLAAATSLALVGSGLAFADNIIADGDGITTVDNAGLAMGEVCATDGSDGYNGGNDQLVRLYLKRTGNAGSQPGTVWANSTAVGLTHTEGHAAIAVTMPTPSSITTPPTWTTSNDTTAGPASAVVRVQETTLGLLDGNGSARKINFIASGAAVDGSTLPKDKDVEVTATIVNSSNAARQDCVLPSATIATPAAATAPAITEIEQNNVVASSFTCADSQETVPLNTLIRSCKGSVLPPGTGATATSAADSGFNLPTSVLGVHTLTVTATDNAGNVKTESRDYEVVAPSAAPVATFLQPIDGDVINVAKSGRVIPVKVTIAGATGLTFGDVTLHMNVNNCVTGSTDGVEEYSAGTANSGNAFRLDDDKWIFNLATGKAGSCSVGTVKVKGVYAGDFEIKYTK